MGFENSNGKTVLRCDECGDLLYSQITGETIEDNIAVVKRRAKEIGWTVSNGTFKCQICSAFAGAELW
jgi:hypothetical protein